MTTLNEPVQASTIPASLKSMMDLVSPFGLVSRLSWLKATEGEPEYQIVSGSLGNPGEVLTAQSSWSHDPASGNFDGAAWRPGL